MYLDKHMPAVKIFFPANDNRRMRDMTWQEAVEFARKHAKLIAHSILPLGRTE